MIRTLVERRVAITSTLAVLEGGDRPDLEAIPHLRELFPPDIWAIQLRRNRDQRPAAAFFAPMLRKEMAFERAFVAAGGLLMAGCDPTGDGHVIAGLGDQRNIELLHEAGFTVPEAIRIATLNGAIFLGRADRIGSLEAGKRADIVLLDGDLMRDIRAINGRCSSSRTAWATIRRRSMRASGDRWGCTDLRAVAGDPSRLRIRPCATPSPRSC